MKISFNFCRDKSFNLPFNFTILIPDCLLILFYTLKHNVSYLAHPCFKRNKTKKEKSIGVDFN